MTRPGTSTRILFLIAIAIVAADAGPASAEPIKCQREIAKRSARLVQTRMRALQKCEDQVLAGTNAGPCPDATATRKIQRAADKLASATASACGGRDRTCGTVDDEALAAIGWDIGTCPSFYGGVCTNAIATCSDIAACVRCIGEAAVDQAITLYYRDAAPTTAEPVLTCQRTIGKEAARFFRKKTRALQRCADAVLKGDRPGPCPDAATSAKIAAAEATKQSRICRRCGGADHRCAGGDDLTPATIGFASACLAVTVPGGATCGQPIGTLQDIVDCVGCVTEFDADCTDAAAVPGLAAYPSDCVARCPDYTVTRQPFFGDTHVHTTYSLDASTQGTLMTPEQAYRFARGEQVPIQPFDDEGMPLRHLQLARPLDFAVVSDHAEFFGEITICEDPDHPNYNAPECMLYRNNPDQAFLVINALLSSPAPMRFPTVCGVGGAQCVEAAKTPWGIIQEDTNAAYDRCAFTTLNGYEWTGSPAVFNLHRNVFFAGTAVPEVPTSYFEAPTPEQLWAALDQTCHADTPGCRATTVPHNSNVSGGLMFKTTDGNNQPFTPAYAATKNRFEPLVEIFQHKGDSECFQLSGPGANDELCGFEKFPYNNLIFDRFGGLGTGPPGESDFVRDALKTGLQLEQSLGVNPFKYGIIASTDTHIGAPGSVIEKDFPGHGGAGNSTSGELPPGLNDKVYFNPGGLAVVWAEENTRESLFAAVERREAYGTSGPRITLRLFGGWGYDAGMCADPGTFPSVGYAGGVPMGRDLPPPTAASPTFAMYALKDPGAVVGPRTSPYDGEPSTPLQKIQIIKGWIDSGGQKQEAVYDVAGGNDASVDPTTCSAIPPSVGMSHDELCAVWEDPDFDPALPAFYYVRVVEDPVCRWTTLVCNARGVDCNVPSTITEGLEGCCNADYPKTIQERAWSSPIWYRP